jgi:hypothetical protein
MLAMKAGWPVRLTRSATGTHLPITRCLGYIVTPTPSSRRIDVALAVLAVVVVCLGLILIKAVPVLVGIGLMLAGLVVVLAIGERRDRARQRGIGHGIDRLDPNRAAIPAGSEPNPDQAMRDQVDANIWTQPPRREDS